MENETIIALVIALAAVVVGPAIQLQIAKRQIRAQLVSANRLRWIGELRADIADFIARIFILTSRNIDAANLDQLLHTSQQISLRLNLKETAHQDLDKMLISLAQACREFLQTRTSDEQLRKKTSRALDGIAKSVSNSAREILKTEWERVKRGE